MNKKENKQLIHWISSVPWSFNQNVIIRDVHRENGISIITSRYIKAELYPSIFVTCMRNTYTTEKEDPIISPQMLDEKKTVFF